jgi:hypothetical protein
MTPAQLIAATPVRVSGEWLADGAPYNSRIKVILVCYETHDANLLRWMCNRVWGHEFRNLTLARVERTLVGATREKLTPFIRTFYSATCDELQAGHYNDGGRDDEEDH